MLHGSSYRNKIFSTQISLELLVGSPSQVACIKRVAGQCRRSYHRHGGGGGTH